MTKSELDDLRLDLALKAKNGIDFILAATIIWFGIAYIWTPSFSAYDKSILTFIVGGLLLPLALLLSKILKTQWKIKENPLQPLGLWLNFAQLFYFPMLVFILLQHPDYFVMAYVIITGAHFFPYAWFYNEIGFAIMAGVISVGALLIALFVPVEQIFLTAVFMGIMLIVLAIWINMSYKRKKTALQNKAEV